MHFYGFNIGDYASHTKHLTLLEDLAYRRLLDLYYLQEQPLHGDASAIARLIGMREHSAEVATVLQDFFQETPEGWRNERADEEVTAYRKKAKLAAKAGRASAERRGNARSTDVQRPFNGRSTGAQRMLNDRSTRPAKTHEARSTDVQPNTPSTTPKKHSQEPQMNTCMNEGSLSSYQKQSGEGGGTPVPRTGQQEAGDVAAKVLRAVTP